MVETNLPSKIDRYEIKDVLGQGAMGKILLGYDPKLQRNVAIKVISEAGKTASKGLERFHREARAIAALRHPNIVEIYDYSGPDSPIVYLVMERLKGIDLFDLLDREGTLPEPIVAAIGKDVCSALAEAHRSGVIHRDLKPENIYIDQNGRIVLTDFGIAKALEEGNKVETDWSEHTEVVGTPGFMAPEQMTGGTLSPQTDLFALGAMLYNVLTRELPFDGNSPLAMFKAINAQKYNDPRLLFPLVTKQMADVLRSCLYVNPQDRPESAEKLEAIFGEILQLWGVVDYRQDIRLYVSDSAAYKVMYKERALQHELDILKIALKDHDNAAEAVARKRIKLIDPSNQEQERLAESGIFIMTGQGQVPKRIFGNSSAPTEMTAEDTTSDRPEDFTKKGGFSWLYYGGILLGGVLLSVVVLSIIFHSHPEGLQQPAPLAAAADGTSDSAAIPLPAVPAMAEAATEEIVQPPQELTVTVIIRAPKKALIWLDGDKYKNNNIPLQLVAGSQHLLKAQLGKGRSFTYSFVVPEAKRGQLNVNFTKRKVVAKWQQ